MDSWSSMTTGRILTDWLNMFCNILFFRHRKYSQMASRHFCNEIMVSIYLSLRKGQDKCRNLMPSIIIYKIRTIKLVISGSSLLITFFLNLKNPRSTIRFNKFVFPQFYELTNTSEYHSFDIKNNTRSKRGIQKQKLCKLAEQ